MTEPTIKEHEEKVAAPTEPPIKEHEENLAAAEKALAEARAKAAFKEFPKHVEPHASHVVTAAGGHISVPGFLLHHVDRDGKVTVLVHDAEEETKALAAAGKEVV